MRSPTIPRGILPCTPCIAALRRCLCAAASAHVVGRAVLQLVLEFLERPQVRQAASALGLLVATLKLGSLLQGLPWLHCPTAGRN